MDFAIASISQLCTMNHSILYSLLSLCKFVVVLLHPSQLWRALINGLFGVRTISGAETHKMKTREAVSTFPHISRLISPNRLTQSFLLNSGILLIIDSKLNSSKHCAPCCHRQRLYRHPLSLSLSLYIWWKNSRNKEGTIPCSPTEVNILQCPETRKGNITCSTIQVNILRHHISETLWIHHHPYICQQLWLSRDRLGVQSLSASASTCNQYLGGGIIKSMAMEWFSPFVVTFQVSQKYFIRDNV